MRAAAPLTLVFTTGITAIWLTACAGKSEDGPTILAGIGTVTGETQTRALGPQAGAVGVNGPILLPYRGPVGSGTAYRLSLEIEGERASRNPSNSDQRRQFRERHTLEAEIRQLPVAGSDSENSMFLAGLDGFLYSQETQPPPSKREIELGNDRLRIVINDETSIDNRGNRVTGPLEPRMLINRIFGVITHDPSGNPIRLSSRGAPAARQFMNQIPILGAIAYAMISLPPDPITPGSRWTGARIPPSRSGELGLSLTVNYSLAGFELYEGVRCAMILLDASINQDDFTSITGHRFDRVDATLDGKAWVELENSLIRRVILSDQIRVRWAGPGDPKTATKHRIQHATQLELALRNPKKKSKKWSDGTPRFDTR
jgi:hypothetical protein